MMKAKPNGSLIKKETDMTFALRRKEVVKDKPAICQINGQLFSQTARFVCLFCVLTLWSKSSEFY